MTHGVAEGAYGLDEEVVDILSGFSREFWALTVLFFVFGDLITTAVGLTAGGAAEVGPFVAPLLDQYGLLMMLPLKALAVGVCYVLWRIAPEPHAIGVPLGLGMFGVMVTSWNVGVLVVQFFLV